MWETWLTIRIAGVKVGSVREIRLSYDRNIKDVVMPVILRIDPRQATSKRSFDQVLEQLVQRGLTRAEARQEALRRFGPLRSARRRLRHTARRKEGVMSVRETVANIGQDVRYVLRAPGGEILNSTYFSVETAIGRDGSLSRLTLRGMGYGHGVGMCQWGAIGRARAGQDFREILGTYYPGADVGPVE